MKIYSYLLLGAMFLLGGCSDLLDIDPKNKIPADELFSTPEGVQAHMANLYGRLPIEDFPIHRIAASMWESVRM